VAASVAFQREGANGRALESHGNGLQQIVESVNVMPEAHITPAVASAAPEMFIPIDEVGDDRASIRQNDRVLLIVENDLAFARFLLDAAREKGFKGIVTSQGVAALALAAQFRPSAITLDLFLPDINGWRVLHRVKNDAATRHIPVAVVSTDESREQALNSGAYAFVAKP